MTDGDTDPRPTLSAATVTLPAPLGLHGTVSAFDPDQEDWIEYVERLELYFLANSIADPVKKRAILLNAVGPATYRLVKTLAIPRKPTDLEFDQIVEKVKLHFNPKPSPIVKRYEFNTRKQKPNETVAEYVAALRRIAEHCEFGTTLNDMLRDRLVHGIADKRVQDRYLREATLTYGEALSMAQAAETAVKDSLKLRSTGERDDLPPLVTTDHKEDIAVHHLPQDKPTRSRIGRRGVPTHKKGNTTHTDCYRCGGKHDPARCRFKEVACHYCWKRGHIAAVCRKKKADTSKTEQAHQVGATVDKGEEYDMYNISDTGSSEPLIVDVTLNGIPMPMEVDTGASVSLVGEAKFKLLREKGVSLRPSNARLSTYTGECIQVLGVADVKVEHNGQITTLPLIVVPGERPPLLGRSWLSSLRLDWRKIFHVQSSRNLQDVIDSYGEVFKDGLGTVKGITAKIYVDTAAVPKFHKARPVPFSLREKVEQELARLQQQGIIEPVPFSDWATPIVPVVKRDGSVRICGDYKVTVNQVAKLDKYPIPRIEDLFASLSGGQKFSKLDLSHAYQQIELDQESRRYVVINTHKGLFTYNRLPFGVASAPSIFQRVMESVLQGIPGVCTYIDDILVTGQDEQEHLDHLDEVLRRLKEAGMRLKKEKCRFLLPSVDYLGHTISAEGLRTSDTKVEAILQAPAPRSVSELRAFLGLVNYYGKFLPDLASVLSPLYLLLQMKQEWIWDSAQDDAFHKVKELLKSSRLLVHFDSKLPLTLACDASPYGIGAVLSHKTADGERPIAFASRTLTAAEQAYSQLDKEALAIVYGVKKYHQYLYGRPFELKTDHQPLVHIFSQKKATPTMASSRIQRWALTLGAYSYSITFRKGSENSNADALSRLPIPTVCMEPPKPADVVHLMEYLDSSPTTSSQIRVWTDRDPTLSKVKTWILTGWPDTPPDDEELRPYYNRKSELSTEEGCILWGARVVVPVKGRERVIGMLHQAHPGISRMKSLARSYVWWPGIDRDMEACVKSCDPCQQNQKSPQVTPLHPWSWPSKPWTRIHLDYAGPFMGRMFLLIIDAHSKWLDVYPTATTTSTATISLLRKSFSTFGLPEVVVTDNASNFVSEEFETFLRRNGVKHVKTPPYHPASNGLAERAVQTFKSGMKKLKDGSIETKVARFLFKYRLTPQSSTGVSPSELMFGRRLRSPLDNLRPDLGKKSNLTKERQKLSHDSRARYRNFVIGDLVFVKNYRSGDTWLPGKVVKILGSTMYAVLLNDGSCVRKHTDQMRARVETSGGTTEMNCDQEPLEMRIPQTNEEDGHCDPDTSETESDAGRSPSTPDTDRLAASSGAAGPVQNDRNGVEQSHDLSALPQSRRSSRVRNPPVYYGH